jgi:N-glycosylase/DNA lyase
MTLTTRSNTVKPIAEQEATRFDVERVGSRGTKRFLKVTTSRGEGDCAYEYWSGEPWQLGTAAFWEEGARQKEPAGTYALGANLREEVVACILGGYGIPASVGLGAFYALREEGFLDPSNPIREPSLIARLSEPFEHDSRQIRYRFARQRGARVARALDYMAQNQAPEDPNALRAWLTLLPGVGPKTSAWIVRNHCGSSEVAIIDVHIARAGAVAGVFRADWTAQRHYRHMEQAFMQWSEHAGISAANLDAHIWQTLAHSGQHAHDILGLKPNLRRA